jgi:hypothetical protein
MLLVLILQALWARSATSSSNSSATCSKRCTTTIDTYILVYMCPHTPRPTFVLVILVGMLLVLCVLVLLVLLVYMCPRTTSRHATSPHTTGTLGTQCDSQKARALIQVKHASKAHK